MTTEHEGRLPSGIGAELVRYGRALFGLLRETWTEYQHDYARYLAGAMVYYALMSLIPLLLLALAALGLLLRFSGLAAEAQQQVLRAAENQFGAELRATVEQMLGALEQESIIATVVGLVTIWFTASVLFRQLRLSFRALWKKPPPVVSGTIWVVARTMVVEQLTSLAMVMGGGGLLLGALALIAASRWIADVFDRLPLINSFVGWVLAGLSPLTIAVVTYAMLFKFLPPVHLRWRDVLPSAVLCAVAWMVAGTVLTLYGAFFGNNVSASGAIGGLLVIMLWMNLVCQLIFFGAELCKVLALRADGAV